MFERKDGIICIKNGLHFIRTVYGTGYCRFFERGMKEGQFITGMIIGGFLTCCYVRK